MRVNTYVEVNIYYTKYITLIDMYYDIYYISLELQSSQYDACFLHLFLILLLPRYSREPLQLFVSKEKKRKEKWRREKKKWASLILSFLFISLGPHLYIMGKVNIYNIRTAGLIIAEKSLLGPCKMNEHRLYKMQLSSP